MRKAATSNGIRAGKGWIGEIGIDFDCNLPEQSSARVSSTTLLGTWNTSAFSPPSSCFDGMTTVYGPPKLVYEPQTRFALDYAPVLSRDKHYCSRDDLSVVANCVASSAPSL